MVDDPHSFQLQPYNSMHIETWTVDVEDGWHSHLLFFRETAKSTESIEYILDNLTVSELCSSHLALTGLWTYFPDLV